MARLVRPGAVEFFRLPRQRALYALNLTGFSGSRIKAAIAGLTDEIPAGLPPGGKGNLNALAVRNKIRLRRNPPPGNLKILCRLQHGEDYAFVDLFFHKIRRQKQPVENFHLLVSFLRSFTALV